ncbi:MAG: aminoacyl-tRNA hydrolase [Candidatus Kuenenbacteria bacterium]
MYLIVGLGNPGKKYEKTRHNAGFMAIDFLAEKFGFEDFKTKNKFKAEVAEGKSGNEKIIMAKPQTYMNNSGDAVQLLQSFYGIKSENIVVIYDELDLPLGKIRVRDEGSSAGHKGVESIIIKIGTDKFNRIRIGIKNENAEKMPADKFVLSKFGLVEKFKLKNNILDNATDEVEKILKKEKPPC